MRSTRFQRPITYQFYNATVVLIALNVLVFLINYLAPDTRYYLALFPPWVTRRGFVWQLVTYMFVHGGMTHILFNMIGLFLFGTQVERKLGSTEFLVFYLLTGIGAGLFSLAIQQPVVGASGAIYGLLLAYATFFPDSTIFIFGILPLKAPVAVLVFAGLALFSQVASLGAGIAHLTHLAGIGVGYAYIFLRLGINPARVLFNRR